MSFPKSAPTKVFKNVVVAFAEVWYLYKTTTYIFLEPRKRMQLWSTFIPKEVYFWLIEKIYIRANECLGVYHIP